jgi:hypothetical protein
MTLSARDLMIPSIMLFIEQRRLMLITSVIKETKSNIKAIAYAGVVDVKYIE